MSFLNKVNTLKNVEFDQAIKHGLGYQSSDTITGVFSSFTHSWLCSGSKLYVINHSDSTIQSSWTFGENNSELVEITCAIEFHLEGCSIPLLIVGVSSEKVNKICFFNPNTRRIIRTIECNFPVRVLCIIEDGLNDLNPVNDALTRTQGMLAVGCADGTLLVVDLCRNLLLKALNGDFRFVSDEDHAIELCCIDVTSVSTALVDEKLAECQRTQNSLAVRLSDDCDDGITALCYSFESAILYVGTCSGSFLLWNLTKLSCLYHSQSTSRAITSISMLEPCDDPRHNLFLWICYENFSQAVMYCVSFANKYNVEGYGVYYQGFESAGAVYRLVLGTEENVTVLRTINALAVAKTVTKNLAKSFSIPDSDYTQLRLFITSYEVVDSGSGEGGFCMVVFDLNQWYKEQMPDEGLSSCVESVELGRRRGLMHIALDPASLSHYQWVRPLEQHFHPTALDFHLWCIEEEGIRCVEKLGLQSQWLRNMMLVGPSVLLKPQQVFHGAISAGLLPTFIDPPDPDYATIDEERTYVLTVCLENRASTVIEHCAQEWSTGSHPVAGCTLAFLIDWLWHLHGVYKTHGNRMCIPLFDQSGLQFDVGERRALQHCKSLLNIVQTLYTNTIRRYSSFVLNDGFDQKLTAMSLVKFYFDCCLKLVSANLLPEPNDSGRPTSSLVYKFNEINAFVSQKRKEGPFLGDSLIGRSGGEREWEEEGGTGKYPPPSIQSVLRYCLHPSPTTWNKLSLILYLYMDIVNSHTPLTNLRGEEGFEKVKNFQYLMRIPDVHFKIVFAFWFLDHNLFYEGTSLLLDQTILPVDLSDDQHRSILILLTLQGQEKLGLQYLRLKATDLHQLNDFRLELDLLLNNRLINEAFMFQRKHPEYREELLTQFFEGSIKKKLLGQVFGLHLDPKEEAVLLKFLKTSDLTNKGDLQVLLLLSRAKYTEAMSLNDRLNSTVNDPKARAELDTRDMIVRGITGGINSISRDIALENRRYRPPPPGTCPRPLSALIKIKSEPDGPLLQTDSRMLLSAAAKSARHLSDYINLEERKNKKRTYDESESTDIDIGDPPKKRPALWGFGNNVVREFNSIVGSVWPLTPRKAVNSQEREVMELVGTPLIKKRGKKFSPHSKPCSILKGKTPERCLVMDDPNETPTRKTLRFALTENEKQAMSKKTALRLDVQDDELPETSSENNSPISEPVLGRKPLGSHMVTPEKANDNEKEIINTSSLMDSIRGRLRSSKNQLLNDGGVNWRNVAETSKPKTLFTPGTGKKENKSRSKRPLSILKEPTIKILPPTEDTNLDAIASSEPKNLESTPGAEDVQPKQNTPMGLVHDPTLDITLTYSEQKYLQSPSRENEPSPVTSVIFNTTVAKRLFNKDVQNQDENGGRVQQRYLSQESFLDHYKSLRNYKSPDSKNPTRPLENIDEHKKEDTDLLRDQPNLSFSIKTDDTKAETEQKEGSLHEVNAISKESSNNSEKKEESSHEVNETAEEQRSICEEKDMSAEEVTNAYIQIKSTSDRNEEYSEKDTNLDGDAKSIYEYKEESFVKPIDLDEQARSISEHKVESFEQDDDIETEMRITSELKVDSSEEENPECPTSIHAELEENEESPPEEMSQLQIISWESIDKASFEKISDSESLTNECGEPSTNAKTVEEDVSDNEKVICLSSGSEDDNSGALSEDDNSEPDEVFSDSPEYSSSNSDCEEIDLLSMENQDNLNLDSEDSSEEIEQNETNRLVPEDAFENPIEEKRKSIEDDTDSNSGEGEEETNANKEEENLNEYRENTNLENEDVFEDSDTNKENEEPMVPTEAINIDEEDEVANVNSLGGNVQNLVTDNNEDGGNSPRECSEQEEEVEEENNEPLSSIIIIHSEDEDDSDENLAGADDLSRLTAEEREISRYEDPYSTDDGDSDAGHFLENLDHRRRHILVREQLTYPRPFKIKVAPKYVKKCIKNSRSSTERSESHHGAPESSMSSMASSSQFIENNVQNEYLDNSIGSVISPDLNVSRNKSVADNQASVNVDLYAQPSSSKCDDPMVLSEALTDKSEIPMVLSEALTDKSEIPMVLSEALTDKSEIPMVLSEALTDKSEELPKSNDGAIPKPENLQDKVEECKEHETLTSGILNNQEFAFSEDNIIPKDIAQSCDIPKEFKLQKASCIQPNTSKETSATVSEDTINPPCSEEKLKSIIVEQHIGECDVSPQQPSNLEIDMNTISTPVENQWPEFSFSGHLIKSKLVDHTSEGGAPSKLQEEALRGTGQCSEEYKNPLSSENVNKVISEALDLYVNQKPVVEGVNETNLPDFESSTTGEKTRIFDCQSQNIKAHSALPVEELGNSSRNKHSEIENEICSSNEVHLENIIIKSSVESSILPKEVPLDKYSDNSGVSLQMGDVSSSSELKVQNEYYFKSDSIQLPDTSLIKDSELCADITSKTTGISADPISLLQGSYSEKLTAISVASDSCGNETHAVPIQKEQSEKCEENVCSPSYILSVSSEKMVDKIESEQSTTSTHSNTNIPKIVVGIDDTESKGSSSEGEILTVNTDIILQSSEVCSSANLFASEEKCRSSSNILEEKSIVVDSESAPKEKTNSDAIDTSTHDNVFVNVLSSSKTEPFLKVDFEENKEPGTNVFSPSLNDAIAPIVIASTSEKENLMTVGNLDSTGSHNQPSREIIEDTNLSNMNLDIVPDIPKVSCQSFFFGRDEKSETYLRTTAKATFQVGSSLSLPNEDEPVDPMETAMIEDVEEESVPVEEAEITDPINTCMLDVDLSLHLSSEEEPIVDPKPCMMDRSMNTSDSYLVQKARRASRNIDVVSKATSSADVKMQRLTTDTDINKDDKKRLPALIPISVDKPDNETQKNKEKPTKASFGTQTSDCLTGSVSKPLLDNLISKASTDRSQAAVVVDLSEDIEESETDPKQTKSFSSSQISSNRESELKGILKKNVQKERRSSISTRKDGEGGAKKSEESEILQDQKYVRRTRRSSVASSDVANDLQSKLDDLGESSKTSRSGKDPQVHGILKKSSTRRESNINIEEITRSENQADKPVESIPKEKYMSRRRSSSSAIDREHLIAEVKSKSSRYSLEPEVSGILKNKDSRKRRGSCSSETSADLIRRLDEDFPEARRRSRRYSEEPDLQGILKRSQGLPKRSSRKSYHQESSKELDEKTSLLKMSEEDSYYFKKRTRSSDLTSHDNYCDSSSKIGSKRNSEDIRGILKNKSATRPSVSLSEESEYLKLRQEQDFPNDQKSRRSVDRESHSHVKESSRRSKAHSLGIDSESNEGKSENFSEEPVIHGILKKTNRPRRGSHTSETSGDLRQRLEEDFPEEKSRRRRRHSVGSDSLVESTGKHERKYRRYSHASDVIASAEMEKRQPRSSGASSRRGSSEEPATRKIDDDRYSLPLQRRRSTDRRLSTDTALQDDDSLSSKINSTYDRSIEPRRSSRGTTPESKKKNQKNDNRRSIELEDQPSVSKKLDFTVEDNLPVVAKKSRSLQDFPIRRSTRLHPILEEIHEEEEETPRKKRRSLDGLEKEEKPAKTKEKKPFPNMIIVDSDDDSDDSLGQSSRAAENYAKERRLTRTQKNVLMKNLHLIGESSPSTPTSSAPNVNTSSTPRKQGRRRTPVPESPPKTPSRVSLRLQKKPPSESD